MEEQFISALKDNNFLYAKKIKENIKIDEKLFEKVFSMHKLSNWEKIDTFMDKEVANWHSFSMSKKRVFDNFRSNMAHTLKNMGDISFIKEYLKNGEIERLFEEKEYREAFYLLAMLDYVSRVNGIPKCNKFDNIRCYKLKNPSFPTSLLFLNEYSSEDLLEKAINESLPEFIHFNIVEKDVRNVA